MGSEVGMTDDRMDQATPRPWRWDGASLVGTTDDDDHVLTGHVCDACAETGHFCLSGRPANRALIVAAVNDYDRLRAIEAAARLAVEAFDNSHLPHDVAYEDVAETLFALRALLSAPFQEPEEHPE